MEFRPDSLNLVGDVRYHLREMFQTIVETECAVVDLAMFILVNQLLKGFLHRRLDRFWSHWVFPSEHVE